MSLVWLGAATLIMGRVSLETLPSTPLIKELDSSAFCCDADAFALILGHLLLCSIYCLAPHPKMLFTVTIFLESAELTNKFGQFPNFLLILDPQLSYF